MATVFFFAFFTKKTFWFNLVVLGRCSDYGFLFLVKSGGIWDWIVNFHSTMCIAVLLVVPRAAAWMFLIFIFIFLSICQESEIRFSVCSVSLFLHSRAKLGLLLNLLIPLCSDVWGVSSMELTWCYSQISRTADISS